MVVYFLSSLKVQFFGVVCRSYAGGALPRQVRYASALLVLPSSFASDDLPADP